MLHLLLAVACSLGIGMVFKHAGRQGLDRVTLLTANYATAALLAAALIAAGGRSVAGGLAPSGSLLALGVGTGALFIGGFFLLSLATDLAGMSVAAGVMRVSVVIPFVASWLIWEEVPTLLQGAGLACAGVAFFMIAKEERADGRPRPEALPAPVASAEGEAAASGTVVATRSGVAGAPGGDETEAARTFGVLALLFVAGGAADTCMKTFDEAFADQNSRALFLLMIFGVAFLAGAAVLGGRRWRSGRGPRLPVATLGWGAVLGFVNYGSVEFILRAIRALRGPFVFPANNIAIVVGAALLGVWFWDERLSALNAGGLALAALALFLLRP